MASYDVHVGLDDSCDNVASDPNIPQIDLPLEIIIYIMEFLPLADRICASQVCHLWYEAAREHKLHKNELVVLYDNISRPLEILKNSCGTFLNFVFKEVELGAKTKEFWDKFCPTMQSLKLCNCDISERTFVEILLRCSQLQVLKINDSRDLLMPGRVLELESDILLLRKTLTNLRELDLSFNRYLSDALFNRFVAIAPNLEELSVASCQISFHMGLYKRFYPTHLMKCGKRIPSESVLTFNNILEYIIKHVTKMHKLKLSFTCIDNAALSQLAAVPGLKLKALHLQACSQLTNVGVIALTELQNTLTELDLSDCARLTDHTLLAICHNLPNLTFLGIRSCRAITDISVAELFHLKKLQDLNISHCEQVTGEGVAKGLCSQINPILQKLVVSALTLDEQTLCLMAERLPSLIYLDLSWCFVAVTDKSMQAICKHLVWLQTLRITECNKVTDAGFTGIKVAEAVNGVEDDITFRQVETNQNKNRKDVLNRISLRSRAEQEIVQDAKQKLIVLKKCEDQIERISGNSLDRLKGLRYLDIAGCNRITDVSLKFAFHFSNLQHLDLSRCQQISCIGLSFLGIHNPSIDTLILSDCYSVTDEGVLSFVKCLCRLKHLDLQGCTDLTDVSLEAIGKYCYNMKFLDVSNCSNMTVDGLVKMERLLPSLHTVYRPGPSRDNTIDNRSIPPSPPQFNILNVNAPFV